MTRKRGFVRGGYGRKTVSLPARMMKEIDRFIAKHAGMTWSMFMTDAGKQYLEARRRKKGG